MKWFILAALVLSTQVFANSMVFMRETEAGKQIWIKTENESRSLTTDSNWHLYPDVSSNGENVVWVEGADEKGLNVALFNLKDKSKELWKTPTQGMTLHPRFSKNGDMIFFSGLNEKNENKIFYFSPKVMRETYTYEMQDGVKVYSFKPQAIAHDGLGYFPRPTSDGSAVIFQRNLNGKKEIVEYDLRDQSLNVLALGMAPGLSLDERSVVFTSKDQGTWDIYQIDRITKKIVAITNGEKDEMAPTFNLQNEVVFASNKSGHFQLYKVNKGSWEQLEVAEADDYAPQFSGETKWVQKTLTSFPAPLRSSFGAIVHNDKVYLCGGHQGAEHTYPPESFTGAFQVYDMKTSEWKELAPRPHKAHGFQLAAHGNYIYAFGGFTYAAQYKPSWESLDIVERYDIEKNEWKEVARMPRKRSSNVVVTVDDKVYLIGGWDSTPTRENDVEGTFLSQVDIFDLKTETVQEAHYTIPLPLRRAFTASAYNGKILLVGGLGVGSSHFELLANVTEIDPITGVTRELTAMPFATFAPAAEVMDKELFVFGGMFKFSEMSYDYVSHIYALNLEDATWRHTGRYLKETKGFSQVFKLDEKTLGILGGHRYLENLDSPVNTFEIFGK